MKLLKDLDEIYPKLYEFEAKTIIKIDHLWNNQY